MNLDPTGIPLSLFQSILLKWQRISGNDEKLGGSVRRCHILDVASVHRFAACERNRCYSILGGMKLIALFSHADFSPQST